MNKIYYDREKLIDVLKSYKRMIEHHGKEYPTVTLDDIHKSITYVLHTIETNEQ